MTRRFLPVLIVLLLTACVQSEEQAHENPEISNIEQQEETLDITPPSSIKTFDLLCIEKATLEQPPINCLEGISLNDLDKNTMDSVIHTTILKMYELSSNANIDDYVNQETWRLDTTLIPFEMDGFSYDSEEGYYFLTIDFSTIYKWFYQDASNAMRDYLKYKKENPEKISYDAGLIIEPGNMAERLCKMEQILAKDNRFVRDLLYEYFCYELSWIYTGMDNTWAFDYETGVYLPEYKEALNYLIQHGGPVIKHFTKTMEVEMEKSGWKYKEDLRNWINVSMITQKTLDNYPTGIK